MKMEMCTVELKSDEVYEQKIECNNFMVKTNDNMSPIESLSLRAIRK